MSDGVIGNTSGSDLEESRFEAWSDNKAHAIAWAFCITGREVYPDGGAYRGGLVGQQSPYKSVGFLYNTNLAVISNEERNLLRQRDKTAPGFLAMDHAREFSLPIHWDRNDSKSLFENLAITQRNAKEAQNSTKHGFDKEYFSVTLSVFFVKLCVTALILTIMY